MNANSGYTGWSMSNRAVAAYEAGEKPKSRWTKKAMLEEISAYVQDEEAELTEKAKQYLRGLTKEELFNRFFYQSSWHHTSKLFTVTDFYALDEGEMDRYIEKPMARAYRITYSLGKHHAQGKETYATEKKAEKAILGKGFSPIGYSYIRGAFAAGIIVEEYAI